ncbi:MAG TPA: hypothetical protein VFC31_08865 [Candidatus Limnocylindria bacterium]|nr:hypothetical protein [Candidatus Limnocylindria bacterium]
MSLTPPARICVDGVVHCPARRGDTSIESCLSCPWLDEITAGAKGGDRNTIVRCAPPPKPLATTAGGVA